MEKSLKYMAISSFFLMVILFCLFKIETFDFGWHLKAGEYIFTNKSIPRHDMFSYLAQGNRWVDSHWLFQFMVYGFYALGGIPGVIFLRILIVLFTFIFSFLTVYRKEYFQISLLACLFTIFISFQRFLMRPEIFTFFFLAIFFYYTERFSEHPGLSLVVIPLGQLLWANMHGLHLLGIIFLLLYLSGDLLQGFLSNHVSIIPKVEIEAKEWKQKGILFCLTSMALLINANGLDGIVYPYKIFYELRTRPTIFSTLTELTPPFTIHHLSFPEPIIMYKIFLFLSMVTFICQFKRFRLAHILPYGVFLYLSVLAMRNIPLFALVATPVTIRNLYGMEDFFLRNKEKGGLALRSIFKFEGSSGSTGKLVGLLPLRSISQAVSFCFIVFSLGIGILIANNGLYQRLHYLRSFGIGLADTFPVEAVDYLKEENMAGNIFNSSDIGGYLIWKMYPQRQVALDGRWEVYGDFLEKIQQLDDPFYFEQLAARYGIRTIILGKRSLEIRLMWPWLRMNPLWSLTKDTPKAIVFERNN